jgi:hypothetical protein
VSDPFNPPFKIGEVYWRPHSTPTPIDVPCPACFGSCWLTVILGNGESVRVRCDGCDKRADDWRQTGTVREYDHTPRAVRFEIAGIESMHGDEWRLRSTDGDSEYFHRLRATEAEALAEATERARQLEADRMRGHRARRTRATEKVSWHVRYHRKEIADCERRIAWHRTQIEEQSQ